MEAENLPTSIENWYRRATALDRNWQESRREEERLRKKGGRRESTETEPAMTIGVAEKATTASAGDNRACSDGGVERTNAVVVRGSGQGTGRGMQGFLREGTRLLWR